MLRMDRKTIDVLSELIQAQSSALRAIAALGEETTGEKREELNRLVMASAEHLALAAKAFSDG